MICYSTFPSAVPSQARGFSGFGIFEPRASVSILSSIDLFLSSLQVFSGFTPAYQILHRAQLVPALDFTAGGASLQT
jgi:hypothetical protein